MNILSKHSYLKNKSVYICDRTSDANFINCYTIYKILHLTYN